MSNTDTTSTPPSGQGTAGSTDLVTVLQNIVRQLSGLVSAIGGGGGGGGTVVAAKQRLIASSANLPIVASDNILNFNLSTNLAVTVPLYTTRSGNPLTFKDVSGTFGTYTLTLNATGSDTFNGVPSIALSTPRQALTLIPANDGITTGWSIQ